MGRISIRGALTGALLATVAMMAVLVGALTVVTINGDVRREAQERVTHDLTAVRTLYHQHMAAMAERVGHAARTITLDAPDLAARLEDLRLEAGLTVLNACDAEGRPIAGQYPDASARVPVSEDPVLRRALSGQPVWGTVQAPPERLHLEGGAALVNALTVPAISGQDTKVRQGALLWWAAYPMRDEQGRVTGLVYGGQALNLNYDLVDRLRDLVFGEGSYAGKPLGTVTIFLEGTRVATNVLGPDRRRAVGTVVSAEVRQKVLEQGEFWNARARVVDAWYLAAYKPLRDPDGTPVGMLYVGLLEAPYDALFRGLIVRLLGLVGLGALAALGLAILLVNRITAPLERLQSATRKVAAGDVAEPVRVPTTYAEVTGLAESFREMQEAIAERDRHLQAQNRTLEETNARLERANRNYMETLGFVTHELKSPLAAMQSMIDLLVQGYVGPIPEKANATLVRVKRNCEELQDMVKNYLDLSRAERGELVATMVETDLVREVVAPCVEQTQPLFNSRRIELETDCPDSLVIPADPELLRITLTNFLSNAAKYGREGARARLEATREEGAVRVSVWNEGPGFTPEEGERLFQKFSRLKNENTTGKRGSGLGLFLSRQIVEQHGGRVWAESAPGHWARFSLELPSAGPPGS